MFQPNSDSARSISDRLIKPEPNGSSPLITAELSWLNINLFCREKEEVKRKKLRNIENTHGSISVNGAEEKSGYDLIQFDAYISHFFIIFIDCKR